MVVGAHEVFKLLALSNLAVSLLLAVISVTDSALIAVVAGFSFATSQGVLNPPFQTIFVQAVPSEKVGQAMSVFISVVGVVGALAVPLWVWLPTRLLGISPQQGLIHIEPSCSSLS